MTAWIYVRVWMCVYLCNQTFSTNSRTWERTCFRDSPLATFCHSLHYSRKNPLLYLKKMSEKVWYQSSQHSQTKGQVTGYHSAFQWVPCNACTGLRANERNALSRSLPLSISFLSLPSSFLFRHFLSFLRSRRVDLVDLVEKARGALAEVLRSVLT